MAERDMSNQESDSAQAAMPDESSASEPSGEREVRSPGVVHFSRLTIRSQTLSSFPFEDLSIVEEPELTEEERTVCSLFVISSALVE